MHVNFPYKNIGISSIISNNPSNSYHVEQLQAVLGGSLGLDLLAVKAASVQQLFVVPKGTLRRVPTCAPPMNY
jgi:hypothetical protein